MNHQYSTPEPLGIGVADIASLATLFANRVGYFPGGDLEEVVRKLGGRIVTVDFSGGRATDSGSIEIRDDAFEIRLAVDTGPMRNRFTIAHELGHYVLHYLYPNQFLGKTITWLVAERFGTNPVEREANSFAAAFLMPELAYCDEFTQCKGDHFALSRKFVVSTMASEVRAKSLGLER